MNTRDKLKWSKKLRRNNNNYFDFYNNLFVTPIKINAKEILTNNINFAY